jgi:hypothetical protein
MLVKFSTLANGVFIEDNGTDERKPSDRCFRFDANGNAEYALFADLTAYAANLGDVPYDKLLSTAVEAGWTYRLTQRELVTPPGGGALLTFDVHVGRDGVLEFFDSVSIGIPPNNGLYPVSLIARAQIIPTLIHLFFNRLPPLPNTTIGKLLTINSEDETNIFVAIGKSAPKSLYKSVNLGITTTIMRIMTPIMPTRIIIG